MSENAQLRKRREATKSRYAPKPKPPAPSRGWIQTRSG